MPLPGQAVHRGSTPSRARPAGASVAGTDASCAARSAACFHARSASSTRPPRAQVAANAAQRGVLAASRRLSRRAASRRRVRHARARRPRPSSIAARERARAIPGSVRGRTPVSTRSGRSCTSLGDEEPTVWAPLLTTTARASCSGVIGGNTSTTPGGLPSRTTFRTIRVRALAEPIAMRSADNVDAASASHRGVSHTTSNE